MFLNSRRVDALDYSNSMRLSCNNLINLIRGRIIKIFWPIEHNDLLSKTICRPKMIVRSGATFILRWSCLHSIKSETVNKKWPSSLLFQGWCTQWTHLQREKNLFFPSFALMASGYLWYLFRWESLVLSGRGLCKIKYLSKEVQTTLLIHKKSNLQPRQYACSQNKGVFSKCSFFNIENFLTK